MINNITTRTIPANVGGFRGATTANQAASMLFNNDLFETTHADFQAAIRQDFQVTQGKTYNVSGTDLLDAIEENTRLGHTAGADNNKNGAFDPSRDRHGLGKVIDKFTDKVLDNPIVRTVAQIAQFTPLAPVASVVNTVVTARDVVKAVDEGNIKSLASAVIGAGLSSKLSNSLNLAGDATKISVAQQLQKHAMDGLTRATVSTVVEGGDFDDQLKSSLKASAATIVSQIGANKIGDLYSEGKLDYTTHKLAHTALGFAAGTVANGDGISGAVGGLAGSVAGEYFQSENAAVLVSATSAALLGKDPLLAANVAGTVDRFNRQLHQTEIDLITEKAEAFATQKGISKAEATKILLLQALHQVDSYANQRIPDNAGARAFLKTISGGNAAFNDAFGRKSNLFLEQDQNIFKNHARNGEFVLPNKDIFSAAGLSTTRIMGLVTNSQQGNLVAKIFDFGTKALAGEPKEVQKQVLDQLRIETYDQVLKLRTLYGERDVHPNDEKLARDFHSTLGELYALRQATLQGVEVAKASGIIAGIQAEQVEAGLEALQAFDVIMAGGGIGVGTAIDNIAATLRKDEVVQMWAFQGGGRSTRWVLNDPDPNLRGEAVTGHFMVSPDKGASMHGMSPDVPLSESRATTVLNLREGVTYRGSIQDDTRLVEDVLDGKYGSNLKVYMLEQRVQPEILTAIKKAIQTGETGNIRYGFPDVNSFGETVMNCATFFKTCGLAIPADSGKMDEVIKAMKNLDARLITKEDRPNAKQ
ncbi:DUF637 domain-containing protein [Thiothrix lacustris]|uniref:DUF637 domain-containing protein n=1 Tax=Thiothrix lacustris TaxID=525917 RepID=UPI0027E4E940|nr:DUF637 domain-containing protein [Thiothrix lacustris]WMP18553.1 DUF637 domain-containing protein [Thiothrix lacustris]